MNNEEFESITINIQALSRQLHAEERHPNGREYNDLLAYSAKVAEEGTAQQRGDYERLMEDFRANLSANVLAVKMLTTVMLYYQRCKSPVPLEKNTFRP